MRAAVWTPAVKPRALGLLAMTTTPATPAPLAAPPTEVAGSEPVQTPVAAEAAAASASATAALNGEG